MKRAFGFMLLASLVLTVWAVSPMVSRPVWPTAQSQ
jgi:hypothetical protein